MYLLIHSFPFSFPRFFSVTTQLPDSNMITSTPVDISPTPVAISPDPSTALYLLQPLDSQPSDPAPASFVFSPFSPILPRKISTLKPRHVGLASDAFETSKRSKSKRKPTRNGRMACATLYTQELSAVRTPVQGGSRASKRIKSEQQKEPKNSGVLFMEADPIATSSNPKLDIFTFEDG